MTSLSSQTRRWHPAHYFGGHPTWPVYNICFFYTRRRIWTVSLQSYLPDHHYFLSTTRFQFTGVCAVRTLQHYIINLLFKLLNVEPNLSSSFDKASGLWDDPLRSISRVVGHIEVSHIGICLDLFQSFSPTQDKVRRGTNHLWGNVG